jgi:ABC-type nitrate/sulfonate/bicarbonate transport system substrate-binding protein
MQHPSDLLTSTAKRDMKALPQADSEQQFSGRGTTMLKSHCLQQCIRVAAFCAIAALSLVRPAQADTTIRVGVQAYLDDIWAGVGAGSFAKRGITLEFQTVTSASSMFAALEGGAIQMGIGGMVSFYVAAANGEDLRWIATTEDVNNSDACMVGPNSKIHSVADLKGKKIGLVFNSVVHGPLLEMLEKYGMSSSDVQLLNLQPPIATAALLKGDIDLACNWDPFTYQVIDVGGKTLFTMADTPSGGWSYVGYVINGSFAQKNPQAVASFLQALKEGQDAYLKDKQPAINAVIKETGLDPKIAEAQAHQMSFIPVPESVTPGTMVTMCGAASGKGMGNIVIEASKFFVRVGTIKQGLLPENFLAPQYAASAFGSTDCTVK